MANNIDYEPGYTRAVAASYPAVPVSGDLCLYGTETGIAEADENSTTLKTSINFGPWVASFPVTDLNTGGIALGASIFASQATPVVLSNDSTGVFVGRAQEVVSNGATATIMVAHPPMTGGILANGAIGVAQIAPAALDGTVVKVTADVAVIGGIPVVHRVDLAAGANGNTDVTLTHKTRVIDAYTVLRGAGVTSATLQVFNGATAITDAMDVSGSDKALIRATTLDDASWDIDAAGTLRITSADGETQPEATVYVIGIRV